MLYFDNLPIITYGNDTARDLTSVLDIVSAVSEDIIQYYRINEGQTLFHVADEIYGDSTLWWLIALLNGIQDIIFDLPVDDDVLVKITKASTPQYLRVLNTDYYSTKTKIGSVIDYTGITGTITSKDFDGTNYYISVDLNDSDIKFPATVSFSVTVSSTVMTIQTFAQSTTLSIASDSHVQWRLDYFKKYDELQEINNNKRVIKVFRPEYKNKILSDIVQSLSE
jgi:hypothetical protein